MPPLSRARDFFAAYTQDLTSDELSRVFTRDTPEAYRFFTRGIDQKAFKALPWHRRAARFTQAFFMAFAMRLTPARRVIYGVALVAAAIGVLSLFRGFTVIGVPIIAPPFFFRIGLPTLAFAPGTHWLIIAFALMNLLVLLEVFDRLSLKRDLEVAREIQLAMLPDGTWAAPGVEASGLTRPANTVGGDFYDILPRPDGRVIVALGDVAGKASPAALLMALFLADAAHAGRRAADAARAGPAPQHPGVEARAAVALHHPVPRPVRSAHRRARVRQRRPDPAAADAGLGGGGEAGHRRHRPGDVRAVQLRVGTHPARAGDALVMYSDGITEAEAPNGQMFEESGLEAAVRATPGVAAGVLGRAVFSAVDHFRQGERLADDLTVLVLSRPVVPPVPIGHVPAA